MALWLGWLLTTGCIDEVTQVAGTGSLYTTRCSAEMDVAGLEYTARCTPPACAARYSDVAVNHVVVAMDPGVRLVGFAERVCVQDLSNAAAMFAPVVEPSGPEPAPSAAGSSDAAPTPK